MALPVSCGGTAEMISAGNAAKAAPTPRPATAISTNSSHSSCARRGTARTRRSGRGPPPEHQRRWPRGERPGDPAPDQAGQREGQQDQAGDHDRRAEPGPLGLGRLGEDRDRREQQVVGQPDQQRGDVRGPGDPPAGQPESTSGDGDRDSQNSQPTRTATAAAATSPQQRRRPAPDLGLAQAQQQPGQPGAQQHGPHDVEPPGRGTGAAAAPRRRRGAPGKLMAAPVQKAACTPPISAISPAVGYPNPTPATTVTDSAATVDRDRSPVSASRAIAIATGVSPRPTSNTN